MQPLALLLENVRGLLLGEARRYFDDTIIGPLAAIGYDVQWRVINAADYGVPQRRERVFVVGFRRSLNIAWRWPAPTHRNRWRTVRAAIDGLPAPANVTGRCDVANHFATPGAKYYASRPYHEHALDAPAKTLTTSWQKAKLRDDGGQLRYLTLREIARLQTFPDAWRFTGSYTERLRQLGNAVPVELARRLARGIAEALGDYSARIR